MTGTVWGLLVTTVLATACARPLGPEDGPLDCGLPKPCDTVSLHEMGLELDPRTAAECFYEVLASGDAAHLQQEFITVSESYFDLYIRGDEPPVYVSTQCEYEGPCQEPEAWRCTLDDLEDLDCSNGDGPPRVCGGMVNWCNSMAMIGLTCP